MKYRKHLISAALVLTLGLSVEASAQSSVPCSPTKDIREQLKKQHDETPVSIGLGVNGSVVEVFASMQGTFTIIASMPTGLSCMIGSGENWEMLSDPFKSVNSALPIHTY